MALHNSIAAALDPSLDVPAGSFPVCFRIFMDIIGILEVGYELSFDSSADRPSVSLPLALTLQT